MNTLSGKTRTTLTEPGMVAGTYETVTTSDRCDPRLPLSPPRSETTPTGSCRSSALRYPVAMNVWPARVYSTPP